MGKSVYSQFDKAWKNKGRRPTGVKYVLKTSKDFDQEIRPLGKQERDRGRTNYNSNLCSATNEFMALAHAEYEAKVITKNDLQAKGKAGPKVDGKSTHGSPPLELRRRHPDVLPKYGIDIGKTKQQVAMKALEVLLSYVERNEKGGQKEKRPVPTIRMSRSVPFRQYTVKDNNLDDTEGTMTFRLSKEKSVIAEYFVPKRYHARKKFVKDKVKNGLGGNVCFTGRDGRAAHITIKVDESFDWLFPPLFARSYDFNMEGAVMVFMNDGDIIPRSPEIDLAINDIRRVNGEIAASEEKSKKLKADRKSHKHGDEGYPKKGDGKQERNMRRRLRLEWIDAHDRLENLMTSVATRVIEKVKAEQSLLCIDNVKPGQTTGTFGQDKMAALLIKMCNEQRIPYVLVPPAYTTVMCAKCNTIGERKEVDGRTDSNVAVCPKCGDYGSHRNGAENVARFGWKIWNDGYQSFKEWLKPLLPEKGKAKAKPRRKSSGRARKGKAADLAVAV
jgi:hypothetical protein